MSDTARLIADGRDVAVVRLARTVNERRRGLLGTDAPSGALWIEPCKQVHTFGMRYAIDVAYVARDGHVLATRTLAPWRVGPFRPRARSVIEVHAGAFEQWNLRPGSRVQLQPRPT